MHTSTVDPRFAPVHLVFSAFLAIIYRDPVVPTVTHQFFFLLVKAYPAPVNQILMIERGRAPLSVDADRASQEQAPHEYPHRKQQEEETPI